jgi:parallel beta-helix repeat protein
MLALSKRIGLGLFATFSFFVFTTLAAHATTIHVPADQPTIQAAIDAASNGDSVLVAPGTYFENINFMGKAITVTSSGGPSVTTINGGGVGAVVTFDTSEGSGSVLSGFTITNGLGGTDSTGVGGGGIQIDSASPTITGNVITSNSAGVNGYGAGISARASSALIQGNEITNNHGESREGGGVFIGDSGSVQLIGNHISSNVAYLGAGVAVNPSATPTIENNTITGNTAKRGNIGASEGGGIFSYGFAAIIQNLISGNSAEQGGGVYLQGEPTPSLVSNTIANNDSADGSGVYDFEVPNSQSQFFNNLIIASPGQIALYCDGSDGGLQDGMAPVVQFSDAFSSDGTGFGGNCAGMAGTNGDLSADPLFLDPAGNFHLQFGSPGIDAGDNSAPNLPSTDLDGHARTVNGTVDLGVYEFTPTTLSFTPSSLNFGSQDLGTTSSPQVVSVTNTGNQSLLLGVSVDVNFTETNSCASAVAPGANCTISVSFAPTTAGNITGNLTLRDNASGSPQSVALTGSGTATTASIAPTSLTFSAQRIGTTSAAQVVTLTNTGANALAVSSITTAGDFGETDDCGTSLAAGANCSINATFSPTASGTRSGSLTITDDASGSPQTVALSGTGTAPSASLSPTSLTFGAQIVGTTSTAQVVTLTNGGNSALSISGIVTTGDFAQTNNCGTSLAAGASCSISVTFMPSAGGARTGTLAVTDDASGSPQTVALGGDGIDFTLSAAPSSVTITAGQQANYTVTATAVGGSFNDSVNLNCSGLPAFSTCQISVSPVTPGAGSASSTLTVQTARQKGRKGTPSGTYTIIITGTSGSLTHSIAVTLVVN